ncbi:MAG: hypothetical protein ABFC24_10205 [Methanoregulaceae archaeon]
MKEQGNQKGKSRKTDSPDVKAPAGTDAKTPVAKAAPMTPKEKIAANQKNKRRK